MATMVSKRYDASAAKIAPEKPYSLDEAIGVLKAMPPAKFDESVDLSFRLGVDPKHADQMVRGAVVLPHGIGKTVRVAVFALSLIHISEPTRLLSISYAVFCLKKKKPTRLMSNSYAV